MSELPKGYAPFNPGPRYKRNQSMIDAQARHILAGAVEKGWTFTAPAHERAAEMRRARAILSGGVQKDAFQFGPTPGEMRSVGSARPSTTTKTRSHPQKETKMSKADRAVQKAVAKSTRRSLEQQAARRAAAAGLGAVAKALAAPRLAKIDQLRRLLNDCDDDQGRRALGALLGREELASGHEREAMAKLGLAKSTGVPLFSTREPKATARSTQFAESGLGGPMTAGTRAPRSITTPGGESQAVGGSNTYVIPTESRITNPRDTFSSINTAPAIHDQLRDILRDGKSRRFTAPAELPSLVNNHQNHQRDTALRRDEIQDEIDSLQKQLDTALAGRDADRASALGYQLTKSKLKAMHRDGDQYTVPIYRGGN